MDVVKLKNQQIEEAINRGIYRHDKRKLAEEQFKQEEQMKLDNAEKFNRAMQEEK